MLLRPQIRSTDRHRLDPIGRLDLQLGLKLPRLFLPVGAAHQREGVLLAQLDGRLIVGASQEEMGFDKTPTAGEVMRMLERGWEAVPAIYDLPLDSIDVGLRPGSRDHMPIIGATMIENLYYATGHFRHGILLTPLTAYAMCDLIADGKTSDDLTSFDPRRFTDN